MIVSLRCFAKYTSSCAAGKSCLNHLQAAGRTTWEQRYSQARRYASRNSDNGPAPVNFPRSPAGPSSLGALQAYGRMQKRSPYITQICTSATIFYLGDLISQSITGKPYEPLSGLRGIIIGAGLAVPGYTWFMWLARNFNYASWPRSLATKVLMQQMVFMPLVQTYFFSMQTLLSGGGFDEARRRIVDAVPVTWVNSWKVWPAVMAFTFTYVPMQYRSLFNAFVGTCWQTYLSWVNQKMKAKEITKGDQRAGAGLTANPVQQAA